MPRYYFHAEDGRVFVDDDGTELPGDDAARLEAVRVLGELLRETPEMFWSHECFRLTVADERGLMLFVLELGVTTAPAAAAGRRGGA